MTTKAEPVAPPLEPSAEREHCPACRFPFTTGEALVEHYKREHQKPTQKRIPYPCDECEHGWDVRPPSRAEGTVLCSSACRRTRMSRERSGENHPNWKGGKHQSRGQRWRLMRLFVRSRDGGCLVCGASESSNGRALHIHHITPEEEVPDHLDAHAETNLMALCDEHHKPLENMGMREQLRKAGISSREDLMFDEEDREYVNKKMDKILPRNHNHLPREASAEWLSRETPTTLADFVEDPREKAEDDEREPEHD